MTRRRPWLFFGLVWLLALPFWGLGALTGIEMLPKLPIAALMVAAPVAAGLILAAREEGAGAFLKRAFDVRRIPHLAWWLPILLLAPMLKVGEFVLARMTGTPVPAPEIEVAQALALAAFFFAGAVAEELGWSGYAAEPLQARLGPLAGALVLGAVWAAIHFVPLLQADRSLAWIGWWSLATVAARVVMVWLYNGAGRSVLAVSLFHMTQNLGWQLYPVHGSYYDPLISAVVTTAAALAVVAFTRGRLASSRAPVPSGDPAHP